MGPAGWEDLGEGRRQRYGGARGCAHMDWDQKKVGPGASTYALGVGLIPGGSTACNLLEDP